MVARRECRYGRGRAPDPLSLLRAWSTVRTRSSMSVPVEPDGAIQPRSLVAGSPEYLAWSDQTHTALTVWRTDTQDYRELRTADQLHEFQFLQFAGHFLLWFGGNASSVLDLASGAGFDVSGTVTGSPDWIAVAQPVAPVKSKGAIVPSRVSLVDARSAPAIAGCG
jgi:hypothetical protein